MINIDELSDEKWASLYNEYLYVTKVKNNNLVKSINAAVGES